MSGAVGAEKRSAPLSARKGKEKPVMQYNDLAVSPAILKAVEKMGFDEMTEIQEKAIPVMMEGRDIIAKAPTGTGKTCAFGIPLIERLSPEKKFVQGLVLCPTRELCTQISDDLRRLALFKEDLSIVSVYGGQPIVKQITALKKDPLVVVATPGRLLDHMNRRTIRLDGVTTVVLDEADEMLDMGFMKDVRRILDHLKKPRQMVMFSATISREVMDISWLYQRDEVEITVKPIEHSEPKITQFSILTTGSQKLEDLERIMRLEKYHKAIIFCNTRYTTARLCEQLCERGFVADCLHGDLAQSDRNRIMSKYKAGEIDVLVATDVAARGIDVSGIDVVFNYEVPLENEYYLHRIGRTGRAKREGTSYVFYSPEEKKHLGEIVRYTRSNVKELRFDESGSLVEA